MRSALTKETRRFFERRLKEVLPQFIPDKHPHLCPGDRLWVWPLQVEGFIYLLLQFDPKVDSFTLELAIVRREGWPSMTFPRGPEGDLLFGESGIRIRLAAILNHRDDPWWDLYRVPFDASADLWVAPPPPIEDLKVKIPRLVEDAIQKLLNGGMTFVARVLAQNNLSPK